jgi:hypothetical protein
MHEDIMLKARKALEQYNEYKHEYSQIISNTLSKSQLRQQQVIHQTHSPLSFNYD